MKLCDRCFKKGDYVKSVDSVKFINTEELFDLCETCSQEVRELCIDLKNKEKIGTSEAHGINGGRAPL